MGVSLVYRHQIKHWALYLTGKVWR